jgi:hypothetical protein
LQEQLKSAQATWQRNYDKLKDSPLWAAYCATNGSAVEYNFDDVVTTVPELKS